MIEDFRPVVVLAAFNEESTIRKVVSESIKLLPVVVVDDGSVDGTGALAKEAGAFVVHHARNLGYEAALTSGLQTAVKRGFTHAITMDADGQHDVSVVQAFLDGLRDGEDLLVGHRDRYQRSSEMVFSFVAKRLWGIADPLCGMKAFNLSLLENFGPFDSYKSVGTEFTIRLIRRGFRAREISVMTKPRVGASRFGGGLKANYKIYRALFFALVDR